MTKKIEALKIVPMTVNGTEIPVQVVFSVAGSLVQYGFSKKGGNQKYLMFAGQEPQVSNDSALIKRMAAAGVTNYKWVEQEIKKLRPFYPNRFVAGVEAGRVDAKVADSTVVKCSCCNQDIKSKSVATFSTKHYGKAICMPCQHKGRKEGKLEFVGKQQAPKSWGASEASASQPQNHIEEPAQPDTVLVQVSSELAEMIRDFAVDTDTQSVEVVRLLCELKKLFGHSTKAASESDDKAVIAEYLRSGKQLSEEELAIHAWYQLHQVHADRASEASVKIAEALDVIKDNGMVPSMMEEIMNDDTTMCLTCHEEKSLDEMHDDFDCKDCHSKLSKTKFGSSAQDVADTQEDGAASEASGDTLSETLNGLEQGEASSEDSVAVVAGHSNNQGAGSTDDDKLSSESTSIEEDLVNLMSQVPSFDGEV